MKIALNTERKPYRVRKLKSHHLYQKHLAALKCHFNKVTIAITMFTCENLGLWRKTVCWAHNNNDRNYARSGRAVSSLSLRQFTETKMGKGGKREISPSVTKTGSSSACGNELFWGRRCRGPRRPSPLPTVAMWAAGKNQKLQLLKNQNSNARHSHIQWWTSSLAHDK